MKKVKNLFVIFLIWRLIDPAIVSGKTISTMTNTKSSVEGEYLLLHGSISCFPKIKVRVDCNGLVLSHFNSNPAGPAREDRFCHINQGRQNRQIDTASSLQTHATQVISKEVTEILKKEIWHTIVKDAKALNYTLIDHSLILNPKSQVIISSRVQTTATPQTEQISVTEICTYQRKSNQTE